MSQNWFKRVKSSGLSIYWISDKSFKKSFKRCQSLAYIPCDDVAICFDVVKSLSPEKFKPILDYIERNYIRSTEKKPARFPIETWNLHERIKKGLTATNNPVESWHSVLTRDMKSHPSIGCVSMNFVWNRQKLNTR